MSWAIVYARIEMDKYDLGVIGKFDTQDEAEKEAKRLETQGYPWAGVIKRFWERD